MEGHAAAFETADHLKPNIKSHFLNLTMLFWYLNETGRQIYFSHPNDYQISLLCCNLNVI